MNMIKNINPTVEDSKLPEILLCEDVRKENLNICLRQDLTTFWLIFIS